MLLQSGMPLDKHIWTERISGLIETGKLQKGLETLAAMMKQWEEAPTNARGHAVQPTIEVVNAAFKGIIRRDRKAALEVLEWAGGHGIKPDVRTYNILIRESFQSEDGNDDVQGLLRSMKERGIAADEATFTIILEEVLGGLGPAPAAEQVSAVHMVMDDIKAAGLQPNAETYGKMLHAVASLPNGADEAIEAVQEHMRADGHAQISPHMALILLGRAQRANPHDSGPVRALLARHGFNSIRTGDQRLWEHVLSAYATAGDASRALALHDEMREAGRPATWQFCLRDLLTCLIEKGMLDEARRVVDGALADVVARAADGVVPARTWRHHFWHLASAHGLLDNTVVPPELRNVLEDGWVVGEPQ
jgi:pentatricopeptide repeat protein